MLSSPHMTIWPALVSPMVEICPAPSNPTAHRYLNCSNVGPSSNTCGPKPLAQHVAGRLQSNAVHWAVEGWRGGRGEGRRKWVVGLGGGTHRVKGVVTGFCRDLLGSARDTLSWLQGVEGRG